jgi:hypothetical protein
MAIIACPECGKQVSSRASSCPGCGHPIAARDREPSPPVVVVQQPRGGSGGGCVLFIILLIIAAVAAAATKPDEPRMKQAIVARHGVGFGIGAALGEAIGTAKYTYNDYIFFATITARGVGGAQRTVATGFFGKVFVPDL